VIVIVWWLVSFTANVVSSNPSRARFTRYYIMW